MCVFFVAKSMTPKTSDPDPFFNRPLECDRCPLKHGVRRMKKSFCLREGLLFNCTVIKGLRRENNFCDGQSHSWPKRLCF